MSRKQWYSEKIPRDKNHWTPKLVLWENQKNDEQLTREIRKKREKYKLLMSGMK